MTPAKKQSVQQFFLQKLAATHYYNLLNNNICKNYTFNPLTYALPKFKMMIHPKLVLRLTACILSSSFIFLTAEKVNAQATQTVTEIITSYNTYFKSSTTAINPVKPDNSHNLLAFTYDGTRYSTGVNDATLTSHGDVFVPEMFKSLPISSISGAITSNTKLALGQLYDGVDNGASNPAPTNSLVLYLTDGLQGLNLGTGIANLPKGDLLFNISNLNPAVIGDGIPDILITQIADPSAGVDQYEFTDASNQTVGTIKSISFSGVDVVANWTADFYEASTNPATLGPGFTKTDRPLRLWAADLSFFGITLANYASIKHFIIHLNGNSDLAFVAYNTKAVLVLPVGITSFTSMVSGNDIQLSWQTATESNSGYFEIESSTDGNQFNELGIVNAAGNSSSNIQYSFEDRNIQSGVHYYRLKQFDKDGKFTYSRIIKQVAFGEKSELSVSVYPNPAINNVIVTHATSAKGDVLNLYNSSGKLLFTKSISPGTTQTNVNVSTYPKGTYIFQLNSSRNEASVVKFLIK